LKTLLKQNCCLIVGVLWMALAGPLSATDIYSNTNNDSLVRLDPGILEVGDEIILKAGSTERYLTNFSFEFWGTNTANPYAFSQLVEASVRFYLNDGLPFNGYPTPGTQFYDSGWFHIDPTERSTMNFGFSDFCTGLYLPVVSNMTWSVQFRGMGPTDSAGVDIYSPPGTGQSYPDYWKNDGGWRLVTNTLPLMTTNLPMDFAARMQASDQPVVLGQPLLTYVVDGSNLVVSWPSDHCGWKLQVQTNAPPSGITTSWYTITDSSTNHVWTLPIDPANGSVFCRLVSP
jgi:hypothetical protein